MKNFDKRIYRNDLQIMRGLAVSAVLLFHANEDIFTFGYLGVDCFFVISGFFVTPLIIDIFEENLQIGSALKKFFKRRFYRLAPALIVILTFSSILIFLLAPPTEHKRFALQGLATLILSGNFGAYKYSADYFNPNPNPLVHTWSLSVEEQIYIFLPFLFAVIFYKIKFKLSAYFKVYMLIFFASISVFLIPKILYHFYNFVGINEIDSFSFYSPVNRIWEFIVGGFVYLYLNYINLKKFSISIYYFLLSCLILLFTLKPIEPVQALILVVMISVLVIITQCLNMLPNLVKALFKWIGDRSYSVYLLHMPLIYIAKNSSIVNIGNNSNRFWQLVVAIFLSLLLGSIVYNRIENYFRISAENKTRLFFSFRKLMIVSLMPVIFFLAMNYGVDRQYWGLDKQANILPPFAGFLDPKCARDKDLPSACLYKNVKFRKTVLLFGDSHAAQISQAVADAAKNQNWNAVVWKQSGCNVLPLIRIEDSKSHLSNNCFNSNLLVRSWVKKNKPDLIIISQYTKRNMSLSDLKTAILEFKYLVPDILFIENNPVFPDSKTFMVSKPILQQLISPVVSYPIFVQESAMDSTNLDASNEISKWANNNGIHTMNFSKIFCKANLCTRFLPSLGWLYRDVDHLSVNGASLTIPKIELFLKSL